jgi:hypothetical protein
MSHEPTLKNVSQMIIKLGEIITNSNRLFVTLLEAGANPTDMIALVREENAVAIGYLTSIQAVVDKMRTTGGGDNGS